MIIISILLGSISLFGHLEKFSLSFSRQYVLIFSILDHLRFFMIYYYHFGVFLSYKILLSPFLPIYFVRGQTNSKCQIMIKYAGEDVESTQPKGIISSTRVENQLVGQVLRCKETQR